MSISIEDSPIWSNPKGAAYKPFSIAMVLS
jgi:hypothetical protein